MYISIDTRVYIVCDKQTDFVGKYLENHTLYGV